MIHARLAMLALSLAAPVRPTGVAQAASVPTPAPQVRVALDTVLVQAVTVEALKRTIKDDRPVGSGYAFPSGHATAAFSLARVAAEYHPKYKWWWYGIAARVAWSRVKVRAHDWDDVIAGAALGCWIGDIETDRRGILFRRWEW